MRRFTLYRQTDTMNCGPTCLKMISKFHGISISITKLQLLSETTRKGSNLKKLADAAEEIGFRTLAVKLSIDDLREKVNLPAILHWQQKHFVVVYKVKKKFVYIADPAYGFLKYSIEEFVKNWVGNNELKEEGLGIVLILEPTQRLKNVEFDDSGERNGFHFLFYYIFRYKKFIFQLSLGLFVGGLLQMIVPFLTQSIVDIGIQNQDINFIYLVLIAQILVFFGKVSVDFIRGWILLHLSARINISLISDFFIKLMRLPISYFDSKITGDIMQRINDHQRIENLLTHTTLNTLFSLFNLVIFSGIIAWYSVSIFAIFFVGSFIYLIWVLLFLKQRKKLDYRRFNQLSNEQSQVIEIINGMQEIKLHNAERLKRWEWENIQVRLFKISMKGLVLEQTQTIGSSLVNELKNIFITIFAAKLVIEGEITLGMMMAISYIIGQLNSPIQQLIGFIYSVQDAKIALERLAEIHNKKEEESFDNEVLNDIPDNLDITLENIQFRFVGSSEIVLRDLSLMIPANKITAIVGASGSGKTTLMKMILKFYEPQDGEIKIGNYNLNTISHRAWREKCGVVMQEGYIFNDTIAKNITIGHERVEQEKLIRAAEIANIREFVDTLPLGFNTKIGLDGVGMSTGQKQRLLIARAVYKNPAIICFDEATSALDARNERVIMENLNEFFKGKTAIVIAHRLSTVKNADQIVVLDKGKIIEIGTHNDLLTLGGSYYNLVKNQLELEKLNAG